jgi:hypothetical protein
MGVKFVLVRGDDSVAAIARYPESVEEEIEGEVVEGDVVEGENPETPVSAVTPEPESEDADDPQDPAGE